MSAAAIILAACASCLIAAFAWTTGQKGGRSETYWSLSMGLAILPLITLLVSPWLSASVPAIADPLEPVAALINSGQDAIQAAPSDPGMPGIAWPRLLLGLWGIGILVRGLVELCRSAALHRRLGSTVPAGAAVEAEVQSVAAALTVGQRIDVRHDRVRSPFVCGLWRPVLVLDARQATDDLVLAHELAHIRRRDSWRRVGVRMAGAMLWFNPFFFLMERERRLAVEIACDRAALFSSDHRRARSYARTLLDAASRGSGPQAALGFGVEPKKALEMRIRSILSQTPKYRPATGPVSLAVMAAACLSIAGYQAADAAGLAVDVQFTAPVVEGRTSSGFGPAAPGPNGPRNHGGQDIAAPAGAPVSAPAPGRVTYAGAAYNGQTSWGNVVEIDHGGGWTTVYAHLQDYAVAPGDAVRAGQTIARVGATGVATGPHVHVEVRRDGERVDPADHIPGLAPATPSDG
ncbi:M23/M56 family metallopeptidase [Hyphobacterium marinum]|uniref:M23/M56 family metallopeptidase n=1 Tax=Hyphobacterium marinum TaxID=3116574 RepID=A0ABU7LYN2_9PROT|nr:M23/M56 family metallopeptidase [Hyphobacterium sp. Y6023]MEE2566115.1 M23/M56 family metallopeptidase [Hyphobacterium sp. Y6023]